MTNRKNFSQISFFAGALLVLAVVTFIACADLTGPDVEAELQPASVQLKTQTFSEGEVFVIVEEPPELIGGIASVLANLQYPATAREAGVEGTVFIEFVVNEHGEPVNQRVVKGIGAGCDEAAMQAVSQVQFRPGKQAGVPVSVRFQLPVKFRLGEQAPTEQTSTVSQPDYDEMPRLTAGPEVYMKRLEAWKASQASGWSEEERRAFEQGLVLFRATIDEQGRVHNPQLRKGVGAQTDQQALQIVSQLRFQPAMKDGKPVAVETNIPVFPLQ